MIRRGWLLAAALSAGPAWGQDVDTGAPMTDTGAPPMDTGASEEGPPADTGARPAPDTGALPVAPPPADTGEPAADTGAPAADTGAPAADTGAPASDPGAPPADPGAPPADTGAPPPEPAEAVPVPVPEPGDTGATPTAPLPPPLAAPAPPSRPSPPRPVGPLPVVPFSPRTADAADEGEGDGIERYRQPFAVIADRAIGTTSVPVEFDWRRNTAQVGVWGSFLSELNNFNSLRGGVLGRFPTKSVVWEVGLSYVAVGDTAATRDLALTPYRQAGRPRRGELDVGVGVPMAEGVVTTGPRWFPAVQMVLNGYVDLRYRVYPSGYRQLTFGQVASSLLNPQLSPEEINNLEGARLEAMVVDRERFGLLLGIGNDFYFKPGLFLSPRVMFSVPLLAGVSETQLLWWSDAQLAIGAAF